MGVWAEPFTTLRLQKIFNLMQDPYERADITSNTFWDWQLNHVGSMYGVMDEVFAVRGDLQGVPAALVPAVVQPGERPGGQAARDQGRSGPCGRPSRCCRSRRSRPSEFVEVRAGSHISEAPVGPRAIRSAGGPARRLGRFFRREG